MIRVMIGFDHRQPVAYSVAQMSVLKHATEPVAITPLILPTLPITRKGLTPFTYSRFLVPWLCGYEGSAIFIDSDVLVRGDISKFWALRDGSAVQVVAHERRFERPSVMIFNNEKCKALTPEFIQTANNPLNLEWTTDIGILPHEWNHLVGYDHPNPDAKLAHFTQGLPCYPEHPKLWNAEFGEEWRRVAAMATETESWEKLMGASVHVPYVIAA